MPICIRLAAVVILLLPSGVAHAGEARRWTVEPEGVTFEATASDFRAWKGPATGAPAFSVAALLAKRKKEFDDYAQEQARELEGPDPPEYGLSVSDETVTFEVLSVVGPILSYREMSGGYTAGTAHPTGYERLGTRDLSRADASPRLLDLFPEKQVVAALKADRWLRKFANPERGFARATSVAELVAALDPDWAQENATGDEPECSLDVSFGDGFGGTFYFHHVEKDRLAVRIPVAPGSEWCNRLALRQEVGLLLPIPDALRVHVARAERGEAGFLAANRKAFGPLKYEGAWEVDIKDLVRRPK
jgi:hypothetical protein